MKKNCVIALLCCALMTGLAVEKQAPPEQQYRARAQETLDQVWNNIRKRHFAKDFESRYRDVYQRFKPKVLMCDNDRELAETLNVMVRELGQSHIMVFPPVRSSVRRALAAARQNTAPLKHIKNVPADPGIVVSSSGGQVCVLRVRAESPAARAGVKPGDIILAVNGVELRTGVSSYVTWPLIATGLLAGLPGTLVDVALSGADGKRREVKLLRMPNGAKWFQIGVMPRMYSAFDARVLPGNIGYIHFTAFFPEMITRCRNEISGKLRGVKGLIIDLRENIGGIILLPEWLAGWVCPQPVKLGKLVIKGVTLRPVSYPQPDGFKGPVAILIDGSSYSAAEVFAAAMQDAGAARLFGSPTSGKCLPSAFLLLPSGFRLQTIFGDYIRPNGKHVEHIGVKPDVPVELSLPDLRQGRDSVIEAARKQLR